MTLTHPVVTPSGVALTDSRFRVAGVHPYPLRPVAYLDPASAEVFGLTGAANQLTVLPDGDANPDDVRRALFEVPAVAGVTSPTGLADAFRQAVDEFVGILAVVALVTVALVLLIAFNSASISADERRREHATMFAYGLRGRTVLGMSMTESALLGVLGTALGVALGSLVLRWMILSQLPDTLPEIGLTVDLSRASILQAAALGIIAPRSGPAVHRWPPPSHGRARNPAGRRVGGRPHGRHSLRPVLSRPRPAPGRRRAPRGRRAPG